MHAPCKVRRVKETRQETVLLKNRGGGWSGRASRSVLVRSVATKTGAGDGPITQAERSSAAPVRARLGSTSCLAAAATSVATIADQLAVVHCCTHLAGPVRAGCMPASCLLRSLSAGGALWAATARRSVARCPGRRAPSVGHAATGWMPPARSARPSLAGERPQWGERPSVGRAPTVGQAAISGGGPGRSWPWPPLGTSVRARSSSPPSGSSCTARPARWLQGVGTECAPVCGKKSMRVFMCPTSSPLAAGGGTGVVRARQGERWSASQG